MLEKWKKTVDEGQNAWKFYLQTSQKLLYNKLNLLYAKLKAYSFSKMRQMSQSIQEWTKPLKDLKEYGLLKADHTHSKFLKAFFHKFYLVHSWILCPRYNVWLRKLLETISPY